MASIFYHVRDADFPAMWTARRTWEPARGKAAPLNSVSPARRSRIRARAKRLYWPPRQNVTINVSSSVRGKASGICGDYKATSSDFTPRSRPEERKTSPVTESHRLYSEREMCIIDEMRYIVDVENQK